MMANLNAPRANELAWPQFMNLTYDLQLVQLPAGLLSPLLLTAKLAFHLVVVAWVLLRRTRYRSSTLAWVILIVAWPFVGAAIYLAFGEVRLGTRRRSNHKEIRQRVRDFRAKERSKTPDPGLPESYLPFATLAESVAGTIPCGGNGAELFGDSEKVVERLIQDIDEAQEHCHLLFYIYFSDTMGQDVAAALGRASQRGVTCRLLVDDVGSRAFLRSDLADKLRQEGVKVTAALPANLVRALFARLDLRNHRKLAVIDGRIGYTGSQNIANPDFASTKSDRKFVDTMMRITGPVVSDLHEIFVVDWFLDTEVALEELLAVPLESDPNGVPIQVMGTGPGSVNEAMLQIILAGILMAKTELIMTTPYFVPDGATQSALITAVRRGVETTLVVPAKSDRPLVHLASRSYFQELLEAGVQIYEYTAGVLHSKTMTVDRNLALVTTANLDRRSFELNFEISTLVFDPGFTGELRRLQESYLRDSDLIDPMAWRRRGWRKRIVENLAGTLSPLM